MIQLIFIHHKSVIIFSFVSWIKCFTLGIYLLRIFPLTLAIYNRADIAMEYRYNVIVLH